MLLFVLAAAGCTPKTGDKSPAGGAPGPASNTGGSGSSTGGSSGSGGSPAGGAPAVTPGTGGASATAGAGPGGSGGANPSGDGGAGPASDSAAVTPPIPMTGGKALLIVGTIPIVGTDQQFESTLKARGLEVEVAQERTVTAANAEGKRVIIFSYSMLSTTFKAEAFTDVPVPIIVTEHFLLPRIKMVVPGQHGYTPSNLTKLTIISDDAELTAGLPKGDVTVYMRNQEMFWGVPTAAAIKIAHIVGAPEKVTYFAYPKGAMMAGAVAPAKRVQFFHATHSPNPVDKNLYLNENGLKLLGATIDWCLK